MTTSALLTLPRTRFIGDNNHSRALTSADVIAWLSTHNYIYYQAPVDIGPVKVYLKSKLKLWKRDPMRFSFGVETFAYGVDRFRIDQSHLARLRIPRDKWFHGITASVLHEHVLSPNPCCTVSHASRGHIKRYGIWSGSERLPVTITKSRVIVCQSNGYHLSFDTLSHAINFCKRQNIPLATHYGRRTRVLVTGHPMNPDSEY